MINEWKCQICGKIRPDDKISVVVKPLIIEGMICGEQNIKYCNDSIECYQKALNYNHKHLPRVKTPKPKTDYFNDFVFNDFVSAVRHLLVGAGISISIVLVCKALTFFGVPEIAASTISAYTILIIPISMGAWLFKILKRDWKKIMAALRGK